MRKKENSFVQNKTSVFIVMSLILIFLITISGTYAWFTWGSTENTELTITIGKMAEVIFTSGNDITDGLTPVFNYTDGLKTTFSVNNRSTSEESFSYTVKLNITTIPSELRSTAVVYTLVKDGVVVAQQNLSNAYNGASIDVYSTQLSSGVTSYEFYLYIDSNIYNSSSMQNKKIVGNITVVQS